MKRVVVMGHGGYANGLKQNIEMIAGPSKHMYFIDLTIEDDLASFENKVNKLIDNFNEDEILFVCDLMGASPFRIAAMLTAANVGKYYTVAGLNTMALLELSVENELSIEELADRAIDTTIKSAARFPE